MKNEKQDEIIKVETRLIASLLLLFHLVETLTED